MPDAISGFPYVDVEFKKDGSINTPGDTQRVIDFVNSNALTDLLVFSHGWNNDMDDARSLYKSFFAEMRAVLDAQFGQKLAGRKFGVLGVLWPSKKFTDDELKPSGAASVGGDLADAVVISRLDSLKGGFDRPDGDAVLDQLKALVPQLETSAAARKQFVEALRTLPQRKEKTPEERDDPFYTAPPEDVLKNLATPTLPGGGGAGGSPAAAMGAGGPPAGMPGPGGGPAAGLGAFFGRIKHAAEDLLNLTTYWQMKERAGTVGAGGVYDLLSAVRAAKPDMKLHLIGHSFGGRVVAAAAKGPQGKPPLKPQTVTLIQAAFSHNGFSPDIDGKPGFFRSVIADGKLGGPVLITHSDKDTAVGRAYPLASRLAGQIANAFGDRSDKFGGLGRNGAIKTAEASDGKLSPVGHPYAFQSGKLYNLEGNAIISGHSDIHKKEIAYAIFTAAAG
jgi:hypothetical protein